MTTMKPRIFVGSSSESLDVAYAVQQNLDKDADVTVWTQGIFQLSSYTLESLLTELQTFDFGVFVFAPNDVTRIRDEEHRTVRDNVLFELGMFLGRLGRKRCFVVHPRGVEDLHLPSDLAGITPGTYDPERPNLAAALGECCTRIRQAIRKHGSVDPVIKRAIEELIEVAARSSARRAGLSANEVRAFAHIYNAGTGQLEPFAMFTGIRRHRDAWLPVPCSGDGGDEDWFVISKAFRTNQCVCEDVDWSRAPKKVGADVVWAELNAVAAYPIAPLDMRSRPIGTICCDSSKKISELEWEHDPDLHDILALLSDAAYGLLTRNT